MLTNPTPKENLDARAKLLKTLGHPVRLLILNLVEMKPRHGEELAMILNLKPATISHHLAKLVEVNLLESRKDQYYQMYSLKSDILSKSLKEIVFLPQPGMSNDVQEDAFSRKVLQTFIKHGRIIQLPAQLKKQLIIFNELAKEFEPEREYTEREVNHILLEFNDDVATFRRGLVDSGNFHRENGIYVRIMKNKDD
jgi:ArsR family transcriptional regulator, arsenate/arsenite/antimonite-responsive transcriptional repressor